MNERIIELSNQCYSADGLLFDHIKFAELIVRECARAVDQVYETAEPDHGCYDWATWAYGSDVLEHFGVEK